MAILELERPAGDVPSPNPTKTEAAAETAGAVERATCSELVNRFVFLNAVELLLANVLDAGDIGDRGVDDRSVRNRERDWGTTHGIPPP